MTPSGAPTPQEQAICANAAELGINLQGTVAQTFPRLEVDTNIVIRIPVVELTGSDELPASYKTALADVAQKNGFELSIVTLAGDEHIRLNVSGNNVDTANNSLGAVANVINAQPDHISVIAECVAPSARPLYLPNIVAVDPALAAFRTVVSPNSDEATGLAYQMKGVIGIYFGTQLTPESPDTAELSSKFKRNGFSLVVSRGQANIEGKITPEDLHSRIELLVDLLKEHAEALRPVKGKLPAESFRTPDAEELVAYRANTIGRNLDLFYPELRHIAREESGACFAYDTGEKFGALFPLPIDFSGKQLAELMQNLPKPANVVYSSTSSDSARALEVAFHHERHTYKPQDIAIFGNLLLRVDAAVEQALKKP